MLVRCAFRELPPIQHDVSDVIVVHGAARGADTLAAQYAETHYYAVEPHPADWEGFGKRAGHVRNAEMVLLGADICLAFPHPSSKGTLDCIDQAWRAGIPVRIYPVRG